MAQKLPLLVQEKVNYYKWYINYRKVMDEYGEKVMIRAEYNTGDVKTYHIKDVMDEGSTKELLVWRPKKSGYRWNYCNDKEKIWNR